MRAAGDMVGCGLRAGPPCPRREFETNPPRAPGVVGPGPPRCDWRTRADAGDNGGPGSGARGRSCRSWPHHGLGGPARCHIG